MPKDFNNANVDVASVGTEITFYSTAGTNTSTAKYLDISNGFARKVNIVPDKQSSLIKINGKDLDDARTVGTNGATIDCDGIGGKVIDSVTVRAESAATHIEVLMG